MTKAFVGMSPIPGQRNPIENSLKSNNSIMKSDAEPGFALDQFAVFAAAQQSIGAELQTMRWTEHDLVAVAHPAHLAPSRRDSSLGRAAKQLIEALLG